MEKTKKELEKIEGDINDITKQGLQGGDVSEILLVVLFLNLTWFTVYLPVVNQGCSFCTSAPCPQKSPSLIFLGHGADVHRQPGLVKYECSLPVLLFNLTSEI